MANQIQLAWSIDATDTTLSPAQAATALGAVVLYLDEVTDPVLGQAFGLTVNDDTTTATSDGAKRTLTLQMTASAAPHAPPPFPCHPTTPTFSILPYPLERAEPLVGTFTLITGSATVAATDSQTPTLNVGDTVQFDSQLGVDYIVNTVSPFTLTTPYVGEFSNDASGFQVFPNEAALPAIYSTSPLDTAEGSGARSVTVTYLDSTGAAGSATTALSGKRPAPLALAGGTIDISVVNSMSIASTGPFDNTVGQITLCNLSEEIDDDDSDDDAQLKIERGLAYLPPSFFALADQGAAAPALTGDFTVFPDSTNVPTTDDQTAVLSTGYTIVFASQPDAEYIVAAVTPKNVTLTAAYEGIAEENGQPALMQPVTTSATLIDPSPATPPATDRIKMLLAQQVTAANTIPPEDPPLTPTTMFPTPTYLSDFFTQTISLALAMPVTPSAIVLI